MTRIKLKTYFLKANFRYLHNVFIDYKTLSLSIYIYIEQRVIDRGNAI